MKSIFAFLMLFFSGLLAAQMPRLVVLAGHADGIQAVAFSPDGQYVLTGSMDTRAKAWDMAGREIQVFLGHNRGVYAVAFSPDGKYVVTGGHDFNYGSAKIWDLASARELKAVRHSSIVSAVSFSPACAADPAGGKYVLLAGDDTAAKLWEVKDTITRSFSGHTGNVTSAVFSPDGKYVLTGSLDSTARLWDMTGRLIRTFRHEDGVSSVAFSPATTTDPAGGKYVLTCGARTPPQLWNINGKQIKRFEDPAGGFKSVTVGLNDLEVMINTAMFSPDGKLVLTGGDTARLWDLSGRQIRSFASPAWATSADFSPDGKQVLIGGLDETVAKLWDLSGQEVQQFTGHGQADFPAAFSNYDGYFLAITDDGIAHLNDMRMVAQAHLFVIDDSSNWVVISPAGLFDASPGAMERIYYVQNLEIIELEQLKERYYEPGLLSKIVGLNKDPIRSVEAFNELPMYPKMTARISDDKLKLQVALSARNGGIGKLSVFVNGKEVQEDANQGRATALKIDLTEFAQYYLPGEPNKLALRVYNEAGWLKSAALELDYQPPAAARGNGTAAAVVANKVKPALYAVVVGTSNYAGDKLDLKFADHDASLFSQALRAAAPKVFGQQVHVTLLNTDAADKTRQDVSSKATIKKAFADIAAKAKAQDVLVVYFSGHGVNYGTAEQGQFYYLTKDIASENLTDPEIRNNYTVSSAELTGWIKSVPALKQVMILDACNSGKIVEDLAGRKDLSSSQVRALDRMKDRTGMFILTGSAADKVSFEASQFGQGLLTYSLLQGMSGLALTDDKRVDVMTLFQYSRDKVPELARGIGGIQTPVLAFPVSGASFDIGIVDAQVKIPLMQVKPVFIRNVFQDDEIFDDVLGLTPALADYFQQQSLLGAQASLIYVDVPEYENAYSMKGRYKVTGDAVEVRGRLFKGKTVIGEFLVTGKKDNMPGLVEAIVQKVSETLDE